MKKRKIVTALLIALPIFVGNVFGAWTVFHEQEGGNVAIPSTNVPVAYIGSDASTKYTSIEKAVEVAKTLGGEQTVYVIPGLKGNDGHALPIYIENDLTITENIKLSLPYNSNLEILNKKFTEKKGTIFSDSTVERVKTYRQTLVVLKENVKLTIASNASLEIGGFIGGTGQGMAGGTCYEYCEVLLLNNAKIESHGSIVCYGYIKEDSLNNGSFVDIISGYIKMPFVIYDFKGGSQTINLIGPFSSNKICPFDIYDLPNVQSKLILRYGTNLYGRARMSGTGFEPDLDVRIVGPTSNDSNPTALILFSGYIELKYDAEFDETTGIPLTTTNVRTTTKASLYGDLALGFIKLSVSLYTIDTRNMYFPFSYRFRFDIFEGSDLSTTKGYNVKFLPGTIVNIFKGATCTINSNAIFYQSDWPGKTKNTAYVYPVSTVGSSHLNVAGTLNISESGCLGAFVEGIEEGATLAINTEKYGESNHISLLDDENTYSMGLKGNISDGSTAEMAYFSKGIYTFNSNAAWEKGSRELKLGKVTISQSSTSNQGTLTANLFDIDGTTGIVDGDFSYSWTYDTNNNVKDSGTNAKTLTLTNNSSSEITIKNISVTVTDNVSNESVTCEQPVEITLGASSGGGCVDPDTKVSLSNGTYKKIKDLTYDDELLVWDLFNGKFVKSKAAIIVNHGYNKYTNITLYFDNQKVVNMIDTHDFFDSDLNKFVSINEGNVSQFIGHNFICLEDGTISKSKLIDYDICEKYTESYSLVSQYHYNFIVEDMLSSTPSLSSFIAFEMDENELKYDEKKMATDIEKYGLYSYDQFSAYITYEQYLMFQGQYLKICVEKGYMSFEDILSLIKMYLS